MHCVAEALSHLFADILPYPYDIARCPHADYLPIIRHAVKGSVNQQPAFTEHRLDVEWHLHVSGIHVLILQDDSVKFQNVSFFDVHAFFKLS